MNRGIEKPTSKRKLKWIVSTIIIFLVDSYSQGHKITNQMHSIFYCIENFKFILLIKKKIKRRTLSSI